MPHEIDHRALRVLAVALSGAVAASVLLHGLESRSAAAWVVPITVVWGLTVGLGVRAGIPFWSTLAVAGVVRAIQVGAVPTLSDDVYRFLFEGQALLAGENPFVHAPSTLAHVDPALARLVNHPEVPSIYPPVAQLWFRVLAMLGATTTMAQLATALVDLGNVAALHQLRARRHQDTWPALLYALHPVAVLESAHGAHLEPLAILFALGALLAWDRSPRSAVGLAVLGVGTKLLPVFLFPALLVRLGLRRMAVALVAPGLLLILLTLPVLFGGWALLDGFSQYSASWSFNGLAFPVLEPLLGTRTRAVCVGLGALVALWACLPPEHGDDHAVHTWWWVATAFLVLSPTVHPWYTLWALVPGLIVGDRRWALAAVSLQASYLVLGTLDGQGGWDPPVWLGPVTWGGALIALLYPRRLDTPTAP